MGTGCACGVLMPHAMNEASRLAVLTAGMEGGRDWNRDGGRLLDQRRRHHTLGIRRHRGSIRVSGVVEVSVAVRLSSDWIDTEIHSACLWATGRPLA